MEIELGQQAIDLGILVTDSAAALGFYRDLLGMEHEGDIPMPIGGGGTMHRLRMGQTLVKLVKLDTVPDARPPGGGIPGATGYRYFTIHANNIAEVMDACREVEDPDGNVVEFVHYA